MWVTTINERLLLRYNKIQLRSIFDIYRIPEDPSSPIKNISKEAIFRYKTRRGKKALRATNDVIREIEFSDPGVNFATFSNPHSKWRLDCFVEESAQGPFDISVPQAVDEGVQHGGDHSVHN